LELLLSAKKDLENRAPAQVVPQIMSLSRHDLDYYPEKDKPNGKDFQPGPCPRCHPGVPTNLPLPGRRSTPFRICSGNLFKMWMVNIGYAIISQICSASLCRGVFSEILNHFLMTVWAIFCCGIPYVS